MQQKKPPPFGRGLTWAGNDYRYYLPGIASNTVSQGDLMSGPLMQDLSD